MSGSGQRLPHDFSNNDNVHLNIALYIVVQIKTITIDWGRIMKIFVASLFSKSFLNEMDFKCLQILS